MVGSYLNKYSKLAKHCIKGKVSLTLAVVVSLMITGHTAFGSPAGETKDLNNELYRVESDEYYYDIGFNAESGSNTIRFENEGEHTVYVRSSGEGGEDAVGVSISGGDRLTIAEEYSTYGEIAVEAYNTAKGIEGNISEDYTLKNSADLFTASGYGDSYGMDLYSDGDSVDLDVENSGDIQLVANAWMEGPIGEPVGEPFMEEMAEPEAVGIATFAIGDSGSTVIDNSGDIRTDWHGEGDGLAVHATGIESYAMGDSRSDSVINNGDIDIYAYERAVGIETATDGDSNNSLVDNDGSVYAYSEEDDAAALSSIIHGGENNTTEIINTGYVEGYSDDYDAIGIAAMTDISGTANTLNVTNEAQGEVYAYADEDADGVYGELQGDENTLNITNKGYIEADGYEDADGIDAEAYGDGNTVNALNTEKGRIYAYSYDGSANGIEVNADGENDTIGVGNTLNVSNAGEIEVEAYYYDADGLDVEIDGLKNTANVSNTGDMYVYSDDDDATGIEVDSDGDENTMDVSNAGYIETEADEDATGMDIDSEGDKNILMVSNTGEMDTFAYDDADGIYAEIYGDENTLDISNSGELYAEGDDDSDGIDVEVDGDSNTISVSNTAKAFDPEEESDPVEVYAYSSEDESDSSDSDGDDADSYAESTTNGLEIDVDGDDNTLTVSNSGDILAESEAYADAYADDGINTSSDSEADAEAYAYADGIDVDIDGDNNTVSITNEADGTITAAAEAEADAEAEIDTAALNQLSQAAQAAQAAYELALATAEGEGAEAIIEAARLEAVAAQSAYSAALEDADAYAYAEAGAEADAVYVEVEGDGNTVEVVNKGTITAEASADASADGYSDDEAYAYSEATGIYASLDGCEDWEEEEFDEKDTLTVTNAEGATIEASADEYATGIYAYSTGPETETTITNAGEITAEAEDAAGIEAELYGYEKTATVSNAGTITATASSEESDAYAVGMDVYSGGQYSDVTVSNDEAGVITATSDYEATGIEVEAYGESTDITTTNAGEITVDSEMYATGIDTYVQGMYSTSAVNNSGTIDVEAEEAIGIDVYVKGQEKTASVSNAGTITATGSSDELESETYAAGIDFYAEGSDSDLAVENTGEITADASEEAAGIDAYAKGSGTVISVKNGTEADSETGGTISASADYYATGMYVETYGESTDVAVENAGEITAEAEEAAGIDAEIHGSEKTALVSNTGTITATGSSEDVETETYALGIDFYAEGSDSDLTVENSGEIAAAASEEAVGVYADIDGSSNISTISNSNTITAATNGDQEWDYAAGIEATVSGDDNDTEVSNSGSIDASAYDYAAGIDVYDLEGDSTETTVSNSGDITAEAENETDGIYAGTWEGYLTNSTLSVINEEGATIDATAVEYATGIYSEVYGDGNTLDVSNAGGITATAEYEATGVYAELDGCSWYEEFDETDEKDTLIVTNALGATIDASADEYATGVYAYSSGPETETTISNAGAITTEAEEATGIEAELYGYDKYAKVSNAGTITAIGSSEDLEPETYAVGMDVYSGGELSEVIVSNDATGVISATADYDAIGINAYSKGPEADLTVENAGDLAAAASEEAVGIEVYAQGIGTETTVNNKLDSSITASADYKATGIDVETYKESTKVDVTNSGDILSTAKYEATGIEADLYGCEKDADVINEGTITATVTATLNNEVVDSGASAVGIDFYSQGSGDDSGSEESIIENNVENTGTITATVNLSEDSEGIEGSDDLSAIYAAGIEVQLSGDDVETEVSNSGTITATVTDKDETGYETFAAGMSTGFMFEDDGADIYGSSLTMSNVKGGLISATGTFAGVGMVAGVDGEDNDITLDNAGDISSEGMFMASGQLAFVDTEAEGETDGTSVTMSNSGTITSDAIMFASGMVEQLYGENITSDMGNSGTITATTEGGESYAVGMSTGFLMMGETEVDNSSLTLSNSGTITAEAGTAVGIAAGVDGEGNDILVENLRTEESTGSITATGEYGAIGITAYVGEDDETGANSLTITNEGDIDAVAGATALGIETYAYGDDTDVAIVNTEAGVIEATSDDDAQGIYVDIEGDNTGAEIDNVGDISAIASDDAFGINAEVTGNYAELGADNDLSIENYGSVSAEGKRATGIYADTYGDDAVTQVLNEGTVSAVAGEYEANGIEVDTTGDYADAVAVNAGAVEATSEEGNATGIEVDSSGYYDSNAVAINIGEVTAASEDREAVGIEVDSGSDEVAETVVQNMGTVTVTGNRGYGIDAISDSDITAVTTVLNAGEITVETDRSAEGLFAGAWGEAATIAVTNAGTITAEADYATGLSTEVEAYSQVGATSTVINTGEISVSGEDVYGIYSYASLAEGSSLTVSNMGLIDASGDEGAGVYIDGDGEFINSGTILASGGVIGVDMSDANTDHMINSGTITSDDTAILMNSQDNQIILEGPGSDITGIVDGGDGEDTIVLKGGANIGFETENISIISVESGESHILEGTTVVLDTAADLAVELDGEGNIIFDEEGHPIRLEDTAEGTLVIDEGSTVVLHVNNEGETSRLDAALIDIDGEVVISTSFLDDTVREELINDDGDSEYHYYHVFTGDVEGFENIRVESAVWQADEGSLILYKTDYVDVEHGEKFQGLATVLDDNDMNAEMETVLDELDKTTTDEEFGDALSQMSGNMYASFPALAAQTTSTFDRNIKEFIHVDGKDGVTQHVSLIGNAGEYEESEENEGFDYQSFGFVAATEKQISSKNTVGLSYGYMDTSADYDDAASNSADIATAHVGVYHEYQGSSWQLATKASYEMNGVEAERKVDFNALDYDIESDFDIDVISIGTELSTVYEAGKWSFKPLLGVTYSYIDQEEINEEGGDVLNINIDSEAYNSIKSELGFRLERKTTLGSITAHASWNHEFGDVYDDIDASIQGADGSYEIYGQQDMEDVYSAGLGMTFGDEEGISYNLNYNFNGNSEYTENMITTGIKYTF